MTWNFNCVFGLSSFFLSIILFPKTQFLYGTWWRLRIKASRHAKKVNKGHKAQQRSTEGRRIRALTGESLIAPIVVSRYGQFFNRHSIFDAILDNSLPKRLRYLRKQKKLERSWPSRCWNSYSIHLPCSWNCWFMGCSF